MGKDSPSPPPAPDYTGAAVAQGTANEAAARLSGRLSNPNIYGPYGSQTVTFGSPSFDQANYDKAMSAYQASPRGAVPMQNQFYTEEGFDTAGYQNAMNKWAAGTNAPTREQYTTNVNADQPTVTQTLNPQAQKTLDAQQRVQTNLANLGEQGIGTAQRILGTPFSFGGPGIQTSLGNAGPISQAPDLSRYGQASGLQGLQAGDVRVNRPIRTVEGTTSMNNPDVFRGKNTPPPPPGNLGNDIEMPPEIAARFAAARAAGMGPQPFNQPTGNLAQALQAPELSAYGMAGSNVNAQPVNRGPQAGQYGMAGAGPSAGQYGFAGGLNTSNVAAMPINAGTTAQQAIMSRLDPSIARNRASTETQLINQGLRPGGEAYNNAINLLGQQENDQRTQAALQGIGLDLSANQQGFGQALQAGQYGNQAIAQNFGQGQAANIAANQAMGLNFNQDLSAQQAQNAAAQQLYNQSMGVQGLQNQSVGQNQQAALSQYQAQLGGQQQGFGQNVTQQQLGNQAITQNQQAALLQQQAALAAQSQQFNQGLQATQFGNTAEQNAFARAMQLRGMPLNEITALMSGSQIQNPQFQPYQGQNVAPAPVAQAVAQQAQYGQNLYNQQMGQANANTAGLYSLGGAGLGALGTMGSTAAGQAALAAFAASDRRLKSNIERIGTHPLGIGIYEYDIFGKRDVGMMADEVESVSPASVITHPSGFQMVDYRSIPNG